MFDRLHTFRLPASEAMHTYEGTTQKNVPNAQIRTHTVRTDQTKAKAPYYDPADLVNKQSNHSEGVQLLRVYKSFFVLLAVVVVVVFFVHSFRHARLILFPVASPRLLLIATVGRLSYMRWIGCYRPLSVDFMSDAIGCLVVCPGVAG